MQPMPHMHSILHGPPVVSMEKAMSRECHPWLAEKTKSSFWLVNELTSIMLFPSPRSIKVITSTAARLTSADLSVFSTADTQLKIW